MHLAAAGGHVGVARLLRACLSPSAAPRLGITQAAQHAVDLPRLSAAFGMQRRSDAAAEPRQGAPRPDEHQDVPVVQSPTQGTVEARAVKQVIDRARDSRELTPLQVAVKACHMRFAEESAQGKSTLIIDIFFA